jgi:hypothetical protein
MIKLATLVISIYGMLDDVTVDTLKTIGDCTVAIRSNGKHNTVCTQTKQRPF